MRSWLVATPLLNTISFLCAVKGSVISSRDVSRQDWWNITSNATTQRAHSLETLHVSCNGSQYGWDLSARSCIDILTVMDEDPHMFTFGPRGVGAWDFPLPQRLVSSKAIHKAALTDAKIGILSVDGRCTFTVTSHTGFLERASMKMIYNAAEELTHTCISGGGARTEGGIATGIGMFGRPCCEAMDSFAHKGCLGG